MARSLKAVSSQGRPLGLYREFWGFYKDRFLYEELKWGSHSSRWRPIVGHDLNISQYVELGSVGVFLRGQKGEKAEAVFERLGHQRTELERALGTPMTEISGVDSVFLDGREGDLEERDNWPWMADWLKEHGKKWQDLVRSTLNRK